jgi:hypothetical protein
MYDDNEPYNRMYTYHKQTLKEIKKEKKERMKERTKVLKQIHKFHLNFNIYSVLCHIYLVVIIHKLQKNRSSFTSKIFQYLVLMPVPVAARSKA